MVEFMTHAAVLGGMFIPIYLVVEKETPWQQENIYLGLTEKNKIQPIDLQRMNLGY